MAPGRQGSGAELARMIAARLAFGARRQRKPSFTVVGAPHAGNEPVQRVLTRPPGPRRRDGSPQPVWLVIPCQTVGAVAMAGQEPHHPGRCSHPVPIRRTRVLVALQHAVGLSALHGISEERTPVGQHRRRGPDIRRHDLAAWPTQQVPRRDRRHTHSTYTRDSGTDVAQERPVLADEERVELGVRPGRPPAR